MVATDPQNHLEKGRQTVNSFAAVKAAAILGAALGSMPLPVKAASGDEAAIRALEDRFAAAVSAKDLGAIMKVYVPDESLFVFDVIPPRQYVGAKAYEQDWQSFLGTFNGPIRFEISDLQVAAEGAMGFGHSIQHVVGSDANGQAVDLTLRVTDVYRKIDGQWLVVHEHVSVPVDLDAGAPDLTSKP
jgi:uncharacterized protein (TIGR02246 family)